MKSIARAVAVFSAMTVVAGLAACAGQPSEGASESANGFTTCDDVDLSKPPAEPTQLRLGGATGIEAYAGWFMMDVSPQELRPNAGVWYQLDDQPFADPSQRVAALQSGQVDGMTSTMPQVLTLKESGVNVRVVAQMAISKNDTPADPRYISKAGSGVNDLSDVGGKTLASIGLGTAAELLLRMAVESAGVDPDGVTIVNVPPPQHISSVEAGTVDVGIGTQPFLKGALDSGSVVDLGGQGIGLVKLKGIDIVEPVNLIFTESFLEQHPEAVCAYLADFRSSLSWLRDDLDEARKVFVEKELIALPADVYLTAPASEWPTGDALPPLDYYYAMAEYAQKYGFILDGSPEAVDSVIWSGLGLTE